MKKLLIILILALIGTCSFADVPSSVYKPNNNPYAYAADNRSGPEDQFISVDGSDPKGSEAKDGFFKMKRDSYIYRVNQINPMNVAAKTSSQGKNTFSIGESEPIVIDNFSDKQIKVIVNVAVSGDGVILYHEDVRRVGNSIDSSVEHDGYRSYSSVLAPNERLSLSNKTYMLCYQYGNPMGSGGKCDEQHYATGYYTIEKAQ